MTQLSVIIPTRNRAKYLAGALESLTKQTHPPNQFEIIVVDNGSTDNTREICDAYANRIPNFRYYFDITPGLHVGRHLGMKVAKSEILAYIDDDIEAFPTWAEGIVESFNDPGVVLVGGKNLPQFEVTPPQWIIKMWHGEKKGDRTMGELSLLDLGDKVKRIDPNYVYGCNFSILKPVLIKAGGFHPDSVPQDLIYLRGDGETHVSDFIRDNGYICMYNPKASVYHCVPKERMTQAYFSKRSYRQGISNSYTRIRRRGLARDWRLLTQILFHFLRIMPKTRFYWSMYLSYWQGFLFHRRSVNQNPALLEWVKRRNYW